MYQYIHCDLFPTKEQIEQIELTLTATRMVYNSMMRDKFNHKQKTGSILYPKSKNYIHLIENYKFVDSFAIHLIERDIFLDFHKRGRMPKWRNKNADTQSYRTHQNNNNIRVEKNRIRLPKLKWVSCKTQSTLPKNAKISFVSVIRKNGNYFANIAFKGSSHSTQSA